jgi:hypothetical protein
MMLRCKGVFCSCKDGAASRLNRLPIDAGDDPRIAARWRRLAISTTELLLHRKISNENFKLKSELISPTCN